MTSDMVVMDYLANLQTNGNAGPASVAFTGNQFWLTMDDPLPGPADYAEAGITLPDLAAMSSTAPYWT